MGDAEVVSREPEQKVLPAYPDENLSKYKSMWKDLIDSGKKKHEDIITMIESKNTLSDKQKKTIRGL